ncbi:MAG: hypothetical protein OIN85_06075 [Candidatus Methanoperedens sp.]|nr:hypothetical protein [Candidatus Methanoperedens sp.]
MLRLKNPKQFMHVLFVLLLFLLFAATPVVLALMAKMSVEDLTKEADVIVIGNIKEVDSRWSQGRTPINTYVTLSVENYIKGGEGQETLTIITQGGSKWGFTVWVEDTPVFTKNEKVLVFLKKAGREFSVAGWAQGKYIVENEEVRDISGEKISLKDFLRSVEDAMPPQDAVTPVRTQAAQASPEAPGFEVVLGSIGVLAMWWRLKK